MSEEVQNNENNQEANVANFGVQDLTIMLNIINVCSERGAFKPAEMQTVGGVYARLVDFLRANGVIKENNENQVEEATEEPAEKITGE